MVVMHHTTSQIVLGTMDFGTRVSRDDSFAILDAFVAGGGVWLDTPPTATPSGTTRAVSGAPASG
jgi:hypothetical protein